MTSRCWLRTLFRSKSRALDRLKEPFGELHPFRCDTPRIPSVGPGPVAVTRPGPTLWPQAILAAGEFFARTRASSARPSVSQTIKELPMLRASWKPRLFARTPQTLRKAPRRCRPQLEALEIRLTPAAPLVVTGAAVIASSGTGATLNGTVILHGSTTTALFQYSTDPTFIPTGASTIGSGFNSPYGV